MSNDEDPVALPGLMPRSQWAAQAKKCDRTAKRLQDQGRICVIYIGRSPFVDVARTAARLKGEDQPRRGRKAA
jgi:hypothetical protein